MLHAAVFMANYHNFVYAKLIYGYHQAAYYFIKRACNHISGCFYNFGFTAGNAHGRL